MPAYYLDNMEMYVLGTNKLKMHTTGVPTFKKIIIISLTGARYIEQGLT